MTAKRLLRWLRKHSCVVVRQRGAHKIVRCEDGCQTVVPDHPGDIPPGTLRNIEKHLEPCLGADWLDQVDD